MFIGRMAGPGVCVRASERKSEIREKKIKQATNQNETKIRKQRF
jgi:hypothetical protein